MTIIEALRVLISSLYSKGHITFEQYRKLWEATEV